MTPSKSAVEWKEEGNAAFTNHNYQLAAQAYWQGLHSCESVPLRVHLHSNRAMALLKLQDYDNAEAECNAVIEDLQHLDNPKVWFRRAQARHGKATRMVTDDPELAKLILGQAKTDLQQSLHAIAKEKPTNDTDNMKKQIIQTAQRIQRALHTLEQLADVVATPHTPHSTENTTGRPTPAQQYHDVMQLLKSRREQLPKHKLQGEAFFLIQWEWWCQWSAYVQLLQNSSIQNYLPTGSILPSSHHNDPLTQQEPGIIDNTSLLLPIGENFYQQWYQPYFVAEIHGRPVKPHLVRGVDYEILPREVYQALRSWYGEASPSICRRTNEHGVVPLYPLASPNETQNYSDTQCGACGRRGVTLRCKVCLAVYYCDGECQKSHWPVHKQSCTSDNQNKRTIPMSQHVPIGLNSLGNTCFMNSALQSLAHATPLTRHFLSNHFLRDLNMDNPLGTGGSLAKAYETVLKDLWWKHNNGSSTSPTALKRAISLFAPRFAGYLQHDAQEFLAYLLDGLHEDLNRIRHKPYVEMPDVEATNNMSVEGARAWRAMQQRDDSLLMETFYGQFKSTCICPTCRRVSVSFDAFNHVSLQIPQKVQVTLNMVVLVFRKEFKLPRRYAVEVPKSSNVADVRRELSELCGIPASRLILCECYDHKITQVLQDIDLVAEMRPSVLLLAYEADPIEADATCHILLSHTLPSASDDITDLHFGPELFGFPLLVSFRADATCREVWNLLWSKVSHLVSSTEFTEDEDRRLLRIQVHNGRGMPCKVFPSKVRPLEVTHDASKMEEDENGSNGNMLTSYLPMDSDEKLVDLLGEKALAGYIFMFFEWHDDAASMSRVDEDRFVDLENDESCLIAQRKQQIRDVNTNVSLDQCFETFIKPERLDEQNMWYCSKCEEHVRAMKTMELWKLPNILVIHLKRFEFKHVFRRDKLDTFVDFPLDGLDMSKHCVPHKESNFVDETVPAIYDCFAVINHFGRMGFGHYTAYARAWNEAGISPEWHLFDDSTVSSAGDGRGSTSTSGGVASPAAYVLFYRRRIFH